MAFYMCLATACLWAGVSGFQEVRGAFYDSEAICILLLAMTTFSPIFAGIAAFVAAWTDERALVALPMVLLFTIITSGVYEKHRRNFLNRPIAIILAMLAYGASREYLTISRSLLTVLGPKAGVGLAGITLFGESAPLAVMTSLSGTWLMVLLGLVTLIAEKRYRMAIAFFGALTAIIVTALSVADQTRSLAYCLPAVLTGMAIVGKSETAENVEILALLCCMVSLITPMMFCQLQLGSRLSQDEETALHLVPGGAVRRE